MKGFKKASQALIAAKELIRPMKRWTQNFLAVRFVEDEYAGVIKPRQCSTKSKEAEAFCALGAVKRVDGPAERSAVAFLRRAASTMVEYPANTESDIFDVNDDDSNSKAYAHRRVMRMFDKAIKAAKAAGN